MSEIVIQAIGFLGLLFFIISYQIRSNKVLFLCQLMGCVVFCIQMLLLGAYTGAVSLLVNILRNILLLKINDWKWVKSRWTLTAVIALLTAVTAYTWSGALSLLPRGRAMAVCGKLKRLHPPLGDSRWVPFV